LTVVALAKERRSREMSLRFVLAGCDRERGTERKKNDVAKHVEVFDHVDLPVNEHPGIIGLPFV